MLLLEPDTCTLVKLSSFFTSLKNLIMVDLSRKASGSKAISSRETLGPFRLRKN